MSKDKPPGRLGRIARLGGLTGRVAGKAVRQRLRDALGRADDAWEGVHLDNARDMVEVMGRLKGAAMKVGQQAAMFADLVDLPEEAGRVLSRLHAEAEPVPFEVIREEVERELEAPLEDLFATFSRKPLGTASLAQAHAATLPSREHVVVKVLHRGVDDAVGTDLAALKAMMISSRALRRSRQEIDEVFDELRARLEEELDYLQEAANLHAFHEVFGDDPRLRIPRPHGALSTERVLTMDRLPGMPIQRFLEDATPAARQRAGRTLVEAYYQQVFVHRLLHADPHPGNYLFELDGRVGLLDFGAVKRFDEFWIGTYARTALAVLDRDRDAALQACIDLGVWDGRRAASGEVLWGFLDAIGQAFDEGERTLGEDDHLVKDLQPHVQRFVLHPDITGPRHLIMLHRSLGGLYALARRLRVRLDFGAFLRPHAEYAIARAEGRDVAPPDVRAMPGPHDGDHDS